MKFHPAFTVALSLLLAPPSRSEEPVKRWEVMDYGHFLSASFDNARGENTLTGKGCAANKAIAVELGKDEGALLFDTETLRMAGGWTGGWVRRQGVAFDGKHGPNPAPPEGAAIYFENNPGPGWSKGADFTDPRALPQGPGAAKVPFGPLPRAWAKYRGLYRAGAEVVFSYSVGNALVLEHPALEKVGDLSVLTRTFQITAEGAGASVKLADVPEGAELIVNEGRAVIASAEANSPAGMTVVGVAGLPAGAKLATEGGFLSLTLPRLTKGLAFKVVYARGASADGAKLGDAVKGAGAPTDLDPLTHGGPAQWPETVTTKGSLAKDETAAYVLDTVGVPLENPYKSWMRIAGLDFFADGRAAICTWSGDVWIVSGLDRELQNVTWKRFAAGLFQTLGLKIVDGQIYALGRDQITRLVDLNGDGEADSYENFNNDVQVTPGFHEFAFDLQTDPEGNFYFSKGGPVNPGGRGWGPLSDHNGCLFKISKDGTKFEVFATGLRAPNGIGVGPKGEVTTGDNQGTWVPVDYLHFVKQGDFIEVPDLAHRGETPPDAFSPHLCWLPYNVDNSNGGQTWVTSDRWGPLLGNLLYLSYGKCLLFNVLQERVNGVAQGGVVAFPFKFDTGAMRGRFNPADGQLYVTGLKGWQTAASKDSALQRVRYTGKAVNLPNELHVTDQGIHITFTSPLEPNAAGDVGNYAIEQWNYRWTKEYGSLEYKISDPEEKGHDTVEIKSVKVSDDRKSVFLEVPDLKPVMQEKITMNLQAEDGSALPKEILHTINVVAPEDHPGTTYVSRP
jgi:hypothetical protein